MNKLTKQMGEKKYLGGFFTIILQRQRSYMSLFGIVFLVVERICALLQIDFGLSEFARSLSPTMVFSSFALFALLWAIFIYVDLKFIIPGERNTMSRRDPIIMEVLEKVNAWSGFLSEKYNRDDLRGNR